MIAPFVLLPPETVPYIIISTIIHWGYYFPQRFLLTRRSVAGSSDCAGATPLLVAGMALVWLGEMLTLLDGRGSFAFQLAF